MLEKILFFVIIIFLFSACIFVHELGHFLMAMWRGLRIERFAIGFGPKIWGTTREWTDRRGQKQKTEFALCSLPFGGYVVLPQISVLDAKQLGEYDPPLTPVAPSDKILTAMAGPLFNVIFAVLIALVVMGIGVRVDKAVYDLRLGYVTPDSPEAKAGLQPGDEVVAINGRPVKDWEEVNEAVMLSTKKGVDVTVKRGSEIKTVSFTPDRVWNARLLSVGPRVNAGVKGVQPGSPADAAGLKAGDLILEIDGVRVLGMMHLMDLVSTRGGQKSTFLVKRGEQTLTLQITPEASRAKGSTDVPRARIGIEPIDKSDAGEITEHPSPLLQIKHVLMLMWRTVSALVHWKESGVTAKDLSGPVGIGQFLWYAVAQGLATALSFMVMININLAVLNLLPIPVLDGGHILFAVIELIRRRPLTYRVASVVQTAFAVLLISFIVYVTYNDVLRAYRMNVKPNKTDIEFLQPKDKESPGGSDAPALPATPVPTP